MTNNLVSPPRLENFFSLLSIKFGKFLVLRGYEFLPTGYSNDIDVYVPEVDLGRFLNCLTQLPGLDTRITILISRLGLIKCELLIEDEVVPFDILYGFYYFGLEYQDCVQLSLNASVHHSQLFYTPALHDEVRISLLKELLHNSRVRSDKATYLYHMMEKCSAELPNKYIDAVTIDTVHDAIRDNNLYLPYTSRMLKRRLLVNNFTNRFFGTLMDIALFVAIKYVFKNSHHRKLIE